MIDSTALTILEMINVAAGDGPRNLFCLVGKLTKYLISNRPSVTSKYGYIMEEITQFLLH